MAFRGQRASEVEKSFPVDTLGGAGESVFQDHVDPFITLRSSRDHVVIGERENEDPKADPCPISWTGIKQSEILTILAI